MSEYAQNATGMDRVVIREKEIKLPQIPELPKTAAFEIKDYIDAGDAGKQNTLNFLNRHFCSLTQRKNTCCPATLLPRALSLHYTLTR